MRAVIADVEIIPWEKAQGWGFEQIKAIWKAYDAVSEKCNGWDYIARID